jgi:ABC-type dipeptide/oligopeptide/nickel transport system permease component
MIWPAITLGYFQVAFIARMTRSSLLEVLREDYMRTAKAKGLSETTATVRHGLRNAIIPVLTIAGIQFVALLGGVVVTETVFNLAGLGTLLVTGVFNRDFALVQTLVFIFAALIIVANLITDLLYAWLDPRIRYQ